MAVEIFRSMVFCASAFLAIAFAQPQGTGVISGTVVDGNSGEAVRKATVTLTLLGTPRQWATTRTDDSGQFEFDALPAGKYDLNAAKTGEGKAIFGANNPRELGQVIALADAETRRGLKLRFLRSASISGHVYDSDGQPLANVSVTLLRESRNLGAPVLVHYRGAGTDDRGEYRFWDVDPGRYFLRAAPQLRGFGPSTAGTPTILVDEYYGGVHDWKEAAPIHVSGGDELAGLDFRLSYEPAVEVRGQVLGLPSESDLPPARGAVAPIDGRGVEVDMNRLDGLDISRHGGFGRGPDHHFFVGIVPAGTYQFEAQFRSGGKVYGAWQSASLAPGISDVTLTLSPAVDIHGTLRIEGEAPKTALRVQLTRTSIRWGSVSANVGPDGGFTLPQVLPGAWQLRVEPLPGGFLKTAMLGKQDVRFSAFQVGSNVDAMLNIVVSTHTATIQGQVDGASSGSARDGILIAPIGPYHDLARFYYGGATSKDGKFHITGIAPGKYKIFAIEKMAAASFRNPEAAGRLDSLGEPISVTEDATVEAHPKLISAERAEQALQ